MAASPPPPASAVAAAFAELTRSFMAGAAAGGQPGGLGGLKRGAEDEGGQQGRLVRARGGNEVGCLSLVYGCEAC